MTLTNKVFRYCDAVYQQMTAGQRAPWKAAVKKPAMSGYTLWMKESIHLATQGYYLPDAPSPSGGFSASDAEPGATYPPPGCVTPPPPPPAPMACTATWQQWNEMIDTGNPTPGGLCREYHITDFASIPWVMCPACTEYPPWVAWGGKMWPAAYGMVCYWYNYQVYSRLTVGGKIYAIWAHMRLFPGVWRLRVLCGVSLAEVWVGLKTTGLTPAGTYIRGWGCSNFPELTVAPGWT